jgi:hypothetical protein
MVWVDFFFTPGAANSSLRARFVTTLLQYRSAIIQVAGIPKVAFQTNSELHLEWVDIFHRLVEAGYYLIATEITSDTANPIIGGLLHYGSSGRFITHQCTWGRSLQRRSTRRLSPFQRDIHLYRGVRHRCIGSLLIGHHGDRAIWHASLPVDPSRH